VKISMSNLKKLLMLGFVCLPMSSWAQAAFNPAGTTELSNIGDFTVDVCQQAGAASYFQIQFSSEHYAHINSMQVYAPDQSLIMALNTSDYKQVDTSAPSVRTYTQLMSVPAYAQSGTYSMQLKTWDGKTYALQDQVDISVTNTCN